MTTVAPKIAKSVWHLLPRRLRGWLRSRTGTQFMRFVPVSLAAVIASQATLAVMVGVAHVTAGTSGVVASIGGAGVSYVLSRWAWHRKGRPHMLKETLPFWAVSVGAWLVEEARPIDWVRLSPRLGSIVARYGDQLLRLKGIIQTAGDPRPLVVHGVQRLFHSPVRLERPTQNRATAIVVIGDKGAQPAIEAIAEALASSVAAEPADPARREHLSTHA